MKKANLNLWTGLITGAFLAAVPHVKAQTTTQGALANLKVQMDSIEADLAASRLDRIHHFAQSINDAVQDLDKDTVLADEKKKRVQGYVKNIAKLTDTMHDAADGKDLGQTRKEEKKLKAQVELLIKQFTKPTKMN
jgi:hypothetical protein